MSEYVLKRDRAIQCRRADVDPEAVAFVVRFRVGKIIKQSDPMTFREAVERRNLLQSNGIELFEDGFRFFDGIGPVEGYTRESLATKAIQGTYNERVISKIAERARLAILNRDAEALDRCQTAAYGIIEKVSGERSASLEKVYVEKVRAACEEKRAKDNEQIEVPA